MAATFRRVLDHAVTLLRTGGELERAAQFTTHYEVTMPAQRTAQLAPDGPAAVWFHAPLDWSALPRLTRAIDRLFAVLGAADVDPTVAFAVATADRFRAHTPTLAALYARTYYGSFMPLLYGAPHDLAYLEACRVEGGLDRMSAIDRWLVAPIVHELSHLGPARDAVVPLHLDECLAGWLGAYVHPDGIAGPDAIYAAPWLVQVGQAMARTFGVRAVVRAHAGVASLPATFVAAAAVFGAADWAARRSLHFLADPFAPRAWLALIEAAGEGVLDPDFDRAIVADGIAAMCLAHARQGGGMRVRAEVPAAPIVVDAERGWFTTAMRDDGDLVPPVYWLPPRVAAPLRALGLAQLDLTLGSVADIADVARGLCQLAWGEPAGSRG